MARRSARLTTYISPAELGLIEALRYTPDAAGIRSQVDTIADLARAECRRRADRGDDRCREALTAYQAEEPPARSGRPPAPLQRFRVPAVATDLPPAPNEYRFQPLPVSDVEETAKHLATGKRQTKDGRIMALGLLRSIARGVDPRTSPAIGMVAVKPPVPEETRQAAARALGDETAKAILEDREIEDVPVGLGRSGKGHK